MFVSYVLRPARRAVVLVLATMLVALAACGDDPGAGPEAPPAVTPVAAVRLSRDSLVLDVGDAHGLAATALDAEGHALAGRAVAWRSSSEHVVTVTGTGALTAHAVGVATVTAEIEGKLATARVRVSAPGYDLVVGTWRLAAVEDRPMPATVRVFLNEPVGDSIIARAEVRADSAFNEVKADGTYLRRYYFTEIHNGRPMYRYSWLDYGFVSVVREPAGGPVSVTLVSNYYQSLGAAGVLRADGRLDLREPLFPQEEVERVVWVK